MMMSLPFDVLLKIRTHGIKVWAEGNNLRVSPAKSLTEEEVEVLRKNKLQLIKELSEPSQPEPEPVPELGGWKPYSVCCWCGVPILMQRETETHFESILVDNITVDHRGCIVCARCHTSQSRKMKDGRLVKTEWKMKRYISPELWKSWGPVDRLRAYVNGGFAMLLECERWSTNVLLRLMRTSNAEERKKTLAEIEELVLEIEQQVGGAIPLQPSKEDQYLE